MRTPDKRKKALLTRLFPFVVPLGFEPRAAGLENLCSIQLSYGTRPGLQDAKLIKEILTNPILIG